MLYILFIILGLSVIYLLGLLFILFQSYDTIKGIMYWFYPDLIDFRIDTEKVILIFLLKSLLILSLELVVLKSQA